MTTGHMFIACNLDGFIARPDGDLDWLMRVDTGGDDHGYDAMIASVDGLIIGRGTFEKVLTFAPWPYHKPVVVMSQSLQPSDIPEALEGRVEICNLTTGLFAATISLRNCTAAEPSNKNGAMWGAVRLLLD